MIFKSAFLILFTLSSLSVLSSGFGGSEGGSGSKTWNIEIPKGNTIDWPIVRIHAGRKLPINHFCIQDDDTLRTLVKYGPKYDFRFDSRTIIRVDRAQQEYQVADRYFDDAGCFGAWDPKCNEVNSYIDETVNIPVYRGEPRATRGGMEDIRDFARRARLLQKVEATIPKCKN